MLRRVFKLVQRSRSRSEELLAYFLRRKGGFGMRMRRNWSVLLRKTHRIASGRKLWEGEASFPFARWSNRRFQTCRVHGGKLGLLRIEWLLWECWRPQRHLRGSSSLLRGCWFQGTALRPTNNTIGAKPRNMQRVSTKTWGNSYIDSWQVSANMIFEKDRTRSAPTSIKERRETLIDRVGIKDIFWCCFMQSKWWLSLFFKEWKEYAAASFAEFSWDHLLDVLTEADWLFWRKGLDCPSGARAEVAQCFLQIEHPAQLGSWASWLNSHFFIWAQFIEEWRPKRSSALLAVDSPRR